jgi:hypothetical protein
MASQQEIDEMSALRRQMAAIQARVDARQPAPPARDFIDQWADDIAAVGRQRAIDRPPQPVHQDAAVRDAEVLAEHHAGARRRHVAELARERGPRGPRRDRNEHGIAMEPNLIQHPFAIPARPSVTTITVRAWLRDGERLANIIVAGGSFMATPDDVKTILDHAGVWYEHGDPALPGYGAAPTELINHYAGLADLQDLLDSVESTNPLLEITIDAIDGGVVDGRVAGHAFVPPAQRPLRAGYDIVQTLLGSAVGA